MALIPSDTLEDIRLQNDIVSIVGQYVRLEKRGRNYVGACPFHQERDPSFSVSSEKQIFYCFGCQAGGNVFKFLMLIENLTFMESVKRLAVKAGIVLPSFEDAQDKGRQAFREERAWEINGLARDFYHQKLLSSTEAESARRYLASRGISQKVIAEFKIGYALNSWDSLIRFFGTRNYSTKELIDIGLVGGDSNRVYDRFRNRIIFPVSNHQAKVVAFGGRIIDKADNDRNQPKYLNTSDTFFFHKSKILYGLDLAIKHIRDKGHAVL
ncbi:MAG: DNA primase, partial [Peptococcaceae bacterium]|nr:DNA primase [Peptococcaceae bacterium]